MRDNIFVNVVDDPFTSSEEWFPLAADNANAPIGVDMPAFVDYRRVRAAATIFKVKKSSQSPEPVWPTAEPIANAPRPALTLV